MRFVPRDHEPVEVKITDKRGGEAPNREDGETPETVPPSSPPALPEGSVPGDEREGIPGAPPPEEVMEAIKQVDFLKLDDQFIVRDVTYRVVSMMPGQNALVIVPVSLGRATLKRMKKVGR